ncbi:MAG TPA: c(7)-type cytochrome triheme domain-containing protein [Anaeromyxobacter sp.]|nr:c(7)-type cytochrome triheme domain-containing protein [Anaeromyxobacter sp.]
MRTPLLASLLGLALASFAAGAADLPRLPKPILLPQGDDSPGQVTFQHESHVDAAKPSCLGCHPQRFPILKDKALPKGTITHEKMLKGEACGACHGKGKAAFDFEDGCENCHAS